MSDFLSQNKFFTSQIINLLCRFWFKKLSANVLLHASLELMSTAVETLKTVGIGKVKLKKFETSTFCHPHCDQLSHL